MSALLIDDLDLHAGIPAESNRWQHVPSEARSTTVTPLPAARRRSAPAATAAWQLTDRGLAVVVGFFVALVATAAVVLVANFISISNAPVPPTISAGRFAAGS